MSRVERDFLGEVEVPIEALFGSFTARARANFQISGLTIGPELITALAEVKIAAVRANAKLGLLEAKLADAIEVAAKEVAEGKHADQFPLDVFQAGAGTPWNMNINEVVSNLANLAFGRALGSYSPVHPNDHVNMSQSSNDTVPTAMRVAALRLGSSLDSELIRLERRLERESTVFADVLKSGRTHQRDAVPITFGQELHAYASAVRGARLGLQTAEGLLRRVPLGGTAVGTGVNTHPHYIDLALEALSEVTRLDLVAVEDTPASLQFFGDILSYVDALATLAATLIKIDNDLMLLSSGPATGLGEVTIPAVEPGSSIMPGKVNPSILECVNMVCFQVLSARATVEAASMHGSLELNVYTPVIAFNLLNAQKWMTSAVSTLTDRCVAGLGVERKVTDYYFEHSNAFATLLSPVIGYEAAAELAREATQKGETVWKLAVEKGLVTETELDELIKSSTEPNLGVVDKLRKARQKNPK